MDLRDPDVVEVVKNLKEKARAFPWIPAGIPPKECYYFLPNGLNLCFTLDLLPREYLVRLARATGTSIPEELGEGGNFWHLSIARLGAEGPTEKELSFWRRAFFEEAPIIEVPGLIPDVKSRHFYWRAEYTMRTNSARVLL